MEPLVHLWWLLEFRTSEENTRPHAVQKNMHRLVKKRHWKHWAGAHTVVELNEDVW